MVWVKIAHDTQLLTYLQTKWVTPTSFFFYIKHHQRYAHTVEDIVTNPDIPLPSERYAQIRTNTENIGDLIELHKDLALQMTNLTKLISTTYSLQNTNIYIPKKENNIKKTDMTYFG